MYTVCARCALLIIIDFFVPMLMSIVNCAFSFGIIAFNIILHAAICGASAIRTKKRTCEVGTVSLNLECGTPSPKSSLP